MTRQQKSGVLLAAVGLAVFLVVPYQVSSDSSAVYPEVVSVLMMVFGGLVALLAKRTEETKSVSLVDPLLLLSMGLVLASVIMIRFVGFYPVICVALPLFLRLFGERDYRKIIPYTLVVVGIIYYFIDYTLGSSLP